MEDEPMSVETLAYWMSVRFGVPFGDVIASMIGKLIDAKIVEVLKKQEDRQCGG